MAPSEPFRGASGLLPPKTVDATWLQHGRVFAVAISRGGCAARGGHPRGAARDEILEKTPEARLFSRHCLRNPASFAPKDESNFHSQPTGCADSWRATTRVKRRDSGPDSGPVSHGIEHEHFFGREKRGILSTLAKNARRSSPARLTMTETRRSGRFVSPAPWPRGAARAAPARYSHWAAPFP
jgi:hypothetical protein